MSSLILVGVILLFAVLWFGPRLADWSAHRAAVETVASEILGREVQIKGEIHLILLPQPSITAEKVRVSDGGGGARMTTAGLTLNLSLGALLTGRIAVSHVELDKPDIRLPWPLPGGPDAIEPPPWLATLSADVTHGSFTFGSLHVRNADFSVVTGGPDNALALDGTATAGGMPLQVDLDLSWPAPNGSAAVHLTLASVSGPASNFDLKGALNARGQVAGQFTAHGADLSEFIAAPARAFDAKGQLTADGQGVHLADVTATIGTMPATGDIALSLPAAGAPPLSQPRLAINLHMPMLDLEPWLRAFPTASSKGLPLRLSLDADAAVYGDGLLRHFGVTLATSPTLLRIDALTAILPGEAGLTLAGFYDPQSSGFTGQMKLDAPSPLVTLHWLAATHLVPDLAGALPGLSSLAIDAGVTAGPGRVAMTGIQGLVNDTTMTGGVVLTDGTNPKLSAGLTFGRVDLDDWLPTGWLVNPPRPDLLARQLGGINADLQLAASEVWLGDDRLDHALLDADINNGSLNVRQFSAQDGGMQILASGAMDAKGALSSGRLILTAPQATPIVDLLPHPLRSLMPDFRAAPLSASLTASGPPTALALGLEGRLGDLGFSAQPVMDLVHDKWQGALTLQYPSAIRFMTSLGFGQAADWLGQGSLSVVANAASDGSAWSVGPLSFSLGMVHGGGHLGYTVKGPPDERRIVGALNFTTLPWPHPNADEPLPFGLLQGWNATLDISAASVVDDLSPLARQLRANLDVSDGVLRLALERARVLGGNAFGTIKLDTATPPTASADLTLQNGELGSGARPAWLPDGLAAHQIDAALQLAARGYSLSSWRASLGGMANITALDGNLPGISLSAARSAGDGVPDRKVLFAGATPFDRLTATATLDQGELALSQAALAGSAGTIAASGDVDLVRGVCNLSLALKPSPSQPPGAQPAASPTFTAVLRGALNDPAAWTVSVTPH
ncbi:MAG TPA: AsmA family protein [Acidisoma sp.]|nr:AsmA family protein [Acidisoma sp.]